MSILTEIFMGKNWNLQIETEIVFKCNLSMKEKYIKKKTSILPISSPQQTDSTWFKASVVSAVINLSSQLVILCSKYLSTLTCEKIQVDPLYSCYFLSFVVMLWIWTHFPYMWVYNHSSLITLLNYLEIHFAFFSPSIASSRETPLLYFPWIRTQL